MVKRTRESFHKLKIGKVRGEVVYRMVERRPSCEECERKREVVERLREVRGNIERGEVGREVI